ncbi:hypothetical protein BH18ACT10_BH18ACT10_10750 [soil metagenome]
MKVLLTILGVLLLVPSVAGAVFGVFMALDSKMRRAGLLFVLWWVPGIVASFGILIRDPATFVMGLVCFVVAGLALLLEERWANKPVSRRRAPTADSQRTTRQNEINDQSEETITERGEEVVTEQNEEAVTEQGEEAVEERSEEAVTEHITKHGDDGS